jgi:hypothetical protein
MTGHDRSEVMGQHPRMFYSDQTAEED